MGFGFGQMMANAIGGQGQQQGQQGGQQSGGGASAQATPCPKCGTANPASAKFCQNCGANTQPQTAAATVTCPNCQAQVQAGAKFCNNCGTKIP